MVSEGRQAKRRAGPYMTPHMVATSCHKAASADGCRRDSILGARPGGGGEERGKRRRRTRQADDARAAADQVFAEQRC